ncbi:MAG: N(4)-(beta-N-acetylglucosaminyl)-L-asparaginase [Planctomycetales bacterium]|nr:N(4)-(beta-N-acetylglucosaminyl)-L-asparaginase [Planctomycetales bacterium]
MVVRRRAIQQSVGALAVLGGGLTMTRATGQETQVAGERTSQTVLPTFIATWPFGQAACEKSRSVLASGGSLRDAVERGINVTELDTSVSSVGYGGRPNAAGIVQLDAAFMDGDKQQAGSVAAIEGYRNPISVARRVMENTPHALLAGAGAAEFAKQQGFIRQETLTDDARAAWEKWKSAQQAGVSDKADNHDTIALLGVDAQRRLVGGCSTSGLSFKLPGRVGDSPIVGSGLYVDGQVGAAGATGIGENVLRYCGSFLIVEFMRQGMSPLQACINAIRRIAEGEQRPPEKLSVNFIAINRAGHVGAAGTDQGFRYAVVDANSSQVLTPELVK